VVVDTSALIAVLLGEPEAEEVAALLERSIVVVPAPTLVETGIVAESRLGPDGVLDLQALLEEAEVAVEPFTEGDARAALDAWRRFGKGRHPAGLNLGDCFAYAVAARRGDSLLFVGDDLEIPQVGHGLVAGLVSQRWVVHASASSRLVMMTAFARAMKASITERRRSVQIASFLKPRLCQELVRSTTHRAPACRGKPFLLRHCCID